MGWGRSRSIGVNLVVVLVTACLLPHPYFSQRKRGGSRVCLSLFLRKMEDLSPNLSPAGEVRGQGQHRARARSILCGYEG